MVLVAALVIAAWAVLLGAAFLARVTLRLRRTGSVAIVLSVYAGLAAAALVWLGFGQQGLLAASGLLLPCTVAIATVVGKSLWGRRR